MSVVIETTLGDITVDLYVTERPRSCLNFLKLCKIKYYNYCVFHNVQRNFIAQSGDPSGTGRGGGSVYHLLYGEQAKFFEAEKIPKIKHKRAGLLSMVNDGNGFHGSQFLITMAENLDSLDGLHTVFGEVAEGMETVMKISEAFCDKENRPYQDIRITHTVILDDPLDDPSGLVIPDRSPDPTEEQIEGCFRIGADEAIMDDEGLDEKEVKEKEEKKEAKHSAQVLEIIGDLPDKDVKPPDNVLFVCKLNSITTDEDLEIIFSRFGTILSCEIIRDYKTGDSLQYAFIEFEEPEMCEKAYSKMDNVLIDDRRIHVDFSQSVSNMNYRRHNKGGGPPQNKKSLQPDSPPPRNRNHTPPARDNRRHRDVTPPRRHRDITPPRRHRDITPPRRHRDITPPRRHRDITPPRRRKKTENGEQLRDGRRHNDRSSSERFRQHDDDDTRHLSRHHFKRHDDVTSGKKRHHNKRQSPARDHERQSNERNNRSRDSSSRSPARTEKKRKKTKKEKKEKKRRKRSYSGISSESDLSSEKEVRCGKHKKRSVSNHKDDASRRRRP